MSTPTDGGKSFQNIGPGNTIAFYLKGGSYLLTAVATFGGGNIQLQTLGPDASTWLNVAAAITANGVTNFANLAPGQYRFAVTTATAVFVTIAGVPD